MNSPPLSESSPRSGKGNRRGISANSSKTAASPLLPPPRQNIQPVATSTVLRVKRNCPALVDPQWATRSISRNPGRASFQSAKVLIGTWLRKSEPGRVRDRPRPLGSARYGANRRSIVAGLNCAYPGHHVLGQGGKTTTVPPHPEHLRAERPHPRHYP